jgi:hypothetical protein
VKRIRSVVGAECEIQIAEVVFKFEQSWSI